MQNIADKFLDWRRQFFRGEKTEKELTDITTQPFWESLRLSKRRLDEKGIVMDVSVAPEKKSSAPRIQPANGAPGRSDGTGSASKASGFYLAGHSVQEVQTRRDFYRNGKRIYHRQEHEISNAGILRARLNGDKALCPNCGHEDRISGFIDGCDYCGSKFLVSDFEPKISAYSLEENIPKKLNKTMGNAYLFLILLSVLGVVGVIAGFAILVALLTRGDNGLNAVYSMIVMTFSLELVPLALRTIIPFTVIFMIGRTYIATRFGARMIGEAIPLNTVPNFSAEDFWQNLDYQLKSIHLAGDGQSASPFASCSLDRVTGQYRDVIDCTLTKLTFLDAAETSDGYTMKLQALLKLVSCERNRIKTRYEQLSLTVFTTREAANQNILAIREYKCPNCGGSVNLLQGGVCEYCKTALDYSQYGWRISSYAVEKLSSGIYRKTQAAIIGVYVLVLALNIFIGGSAVEGDNWLTITTEVQESVKALDAAYSELLLPDQLSGVKMTDSRKSQAERTYVYEAEDGAAAMQDYLQLLSQDTDYFIASVGPNQLIFYVSIEIQGEQGYIQGVVTLDMDEITVTVMPKGDIE